MDGNGWLESMSFMLTDWLMLVTAAAYYAVLLAAVVLVVNVLFRRWISAGQMALLWGLVLLRLVVPVVPSSPLSLESLLQPAEQASETRNTMPATPGNAIAIANPASDSANALSETAATKAASKAPEESNWEMVISDSVPLVWMLVGVCGLGYTVAGYVWFRRRVARVVSSADERILRLWAECCERANVKRTGRIVQFDGIDQPAVMGVFRPTLLLPTNGVKLDDEQLRMVMLHELAHVRRWDVAGNWALVFVRVIHWWNPGYWMAAARYRSLREQACDAFVVRKLEGQSAHGYGELLLALAARRPTESKWRVMLSASILSFFPLRFRLRAVQVRLSALRRAHVRHGRWPLLYSEGRLRRAAGKRANTTLRKFLRWFVKRPSRA
jgi:bla regulator protein BlaR1